MRLVDKFPLSSSMTKLQGMNLKKLQIYAAEKRSVELIRVRHFLLVVQSYLDFLLPSSPSQQHPSFFASAVFRRTAPPPCVTVSPNLLCDVYFRAIIPPVWSMLWNCHIFKCFCTSRKHLCTLCGNVFIWHLCICNSAFKTFDEAASC